ncbi:MAG: IS3 family transposase [Chloroflexia bacterium]|nr:IS3 family transposase [Chloroflexia bacterium]
MLGVARSGSYAWRRRGPSARQQTDQQLSAQMAAAQRASRGTYGAPRIHAALRQRAVRCGCKRVARLMRAAGLSGGRRAARRPRTTIADPTRIPAPNGLGRDFRVTTLDRVWVGDITSVSTGEGWLSVAVLLDACSRRVVGWAMADHLRTDLAQAALVMARRRRPDRGLIHHTDRGGPSTAATYQALLTAHGLTPSMSRAGDCYDNALAESFFATLTAELIATRSWPTRQLARQAIFAWIDVFSNRQRLHSALGFLAPLAFDDRRVPMLHVA